MSAPIAAIFVSSTWLDLQPERAAVEKALQRFREAKFIGMEYFGSRDESTRAASLDEVDRSELYIGIFAGRYGSGITEAEYRRARERQLDCFIYFKADDAVAPEMREGDPAGAEQLAALKNDLRRHTVATFSTPEELAVQVTADVHRWLFDKFLRDRLRQETVGEIYTSGGDESPAAGTEGYRLRVGSALGAVVDASALPAPQRRKTPLLPNVRRFRGLIDRASEIQIALAALPSGLPVEIHGPAGAGKTVLLRTLAYHPDLTGNPDGVVYLDRVAAQPLLDLQQCLYDSFYVSAPRLKPSEGELRQLLREPRALILLDDVEQLGRDLESLFNLLPNCLFCIAAEERRLHGEVKVIALAGLPEKDALALIERELGEPSTPADRAAAATLYELFEGHPSRLIFATASAREQGRSLAEIIANHEAPGKLLQRTVESRSAEERRVLSVLAGLGGYVSKEALAACLPDSALEKFLASLLDAKLIQADGESYALSAGLADAPAPAADLETTLLDTIPRLVGWAEEHRAKGGVIARDFSVFQRAAEWAAGQARWSEVLRLARAVEPALSSSGRWAAWQTVLEMAFRAAHESGDKASHAWALHELGSAAVCLGDAPSAKTFLDQALALRIDLGDHWGAALTRHNLDLLQPAVIPGEHVPQESPPEKPGPRNTVRHRLADLHHVAKIAGLGFLAIAAALIALPLWRQPAAPFQLNFSPARLEFLSTAVDQPSATQIVDAANPGSRPLSIGAVSLSGPDSGDFNVLRNECERTVLPAGSACQVHLRFKPGRADPSVARLIFSDSQGNDTAAIELRGAIESAPSRPAAPLLSARPATMNFGEREVGTRARAEVTVANDGGAPLRLSEFALSGSHRGDFALAGNSCQGVDIAPQTDCKIEIAFIPGAVGGREAVLVLTTIEGAKEEVVLRGGGVAKAVGTITAEPAELNFGNVDLRGREQRQVQLVHGAAAAVAIGRIAIAGEQAGDFTMVADGCQGTTLAEGQRCRLIVSFAPSKPGHREAVLSIAEDTSARVRRIRLFGVGRTSAAVLEFDPPLLDFGERPVNVSPLVRRLAVRNSGAADVRLGRAGIVGDDARHFLIASNDCGATLAAGASCRITVDYRAPAAGAHDGVLRLDFDGGQRDIPLRGRTVTAKTPIASIRPERMDFGAQTLRAHAHSREVLAQNQGSGELVIAQVTLQGSNSFSITNRCTRPLGERESCAIRIDFAPRAAGQQRADLIIAHNAAGSPQRILLSGSGVVAASPAIAINPGNLQFGRQTAGTTSRPQTVTLSNTGAAPLAIHALRIEGNNAGDFVMKSECASREIAPRGQCQVAVRFAPRASTGRRSATLAIHHNAAGGPQRITVNGTAIVRPLSTDGLKIDPDVRFPESGWCCANGNVARSTRTQCAAKKGTLFADEQSARNRCLPVIR